MLCTIVRCMHGCADQSWWLEPGYHLSYMEDNPPYPFQRVKRVDGKDTGVLAIIAPFYDRDYYKVRCPSCRHAPTTSRRTLSRAPLYTGSALSMRCTECCIHSAACLCCCQQHED